ncbi:MAG: SDR family oxidoreductase [Eubacteriales bacterium]|nr:SDR family oxidoreductase [Eubacteriales bacterium]
MPKSTAIITGASRGIGSALAEAFAVNGYRVVINYCFAEREASLLRDRLAAQSLEAEIFRADVAKRSEVDTMTEFCLKKYGRIDLLINNAGISAQRLFTGITEDEWDRMMAVNLKGVFNCTQSVAPYMISAKSGCIINISSVWGIVGASCEVHYSAAKAGVIGFTKALAKELAPSGIRVNCIAPGIIDTDMMKCFSAEEKECMKQEIPAMRFGRIGEVAACALFLASEGAGYITGQVISPNGGFVI